MWIIGKGGEIPGPVSDATSILYTPEHYAFMQLTNLAAIALIVVCIYLFAKNQSRIFSLARSLARRL